MNEQIIKNWNRDIQPNDTVYHLGDFAFGGKTKVLLMLSRLNGKKFLIRGNHDDSVLKPPCSDYFQWIKDYYYLKVEDPDGPDGKTQPIILFHYPILSWNHINYGAWHVFGHCHGSLPVNKNLKCHDVGLDNNCMRPISYDRLKQIMSTRVFKPVDHHGIDPR